jgi:single-strand DNA-binding protein
MSDLNVVTIVGRLGKDPELREAKGTTLCSFSLANSTYKKTGEEWKEDTSWFDVTFFGRDAERIAEKGRKGQRMAVSGQLQQRTWEDQEGKRRERVSILGRQVQFLDRGEKKKTNEDVPF